MDESFDRWNTKKKNLNAVGKVIRFHEREIWWCTIGINIGHEQLSSNEDFSRPVLVLKKFTGDIFWGIPLTTKIKQLPFRIPLALNKTNNDLLVLQMRAYDQKRLVRKINTISETDFKKIRGYINTLLQ
jgi:mRNA interferase MazF